MHSFCNQINIVNKRVGSTDCSYNTKNSVELINNLNMLNNNGLFDILILLLTFIC